MSASSPRGEAKDIVIEGDTIVDLVAPGVVDDENAQRLDASRRLIIPGLINSHTHSHGGLSKGIGDRWNLEVLQTANPWCSLRARAYSTSAQPPGQDAKPGGGDQLQADVAAGETLHAPGDVGQLVVERAHPTLPCRAQNRPPGRDRRKVRTAPSGKAPTETRHRAHAYGCR